MCLFFIIQKSKLRRLVSVFNLRGGGVRYWTRLAKYNIRDRYEMSKGIEKKKDGGIVNGRIYRDTHFEEIKVLYCGET